MQSPVFIMLLHVQPNGGRGSVQGHTGLFVQEMSLGEGVQELATITASEDCEM